MRKQVLAVLALLSIACGVPSDAPKQAKATKESPPVQKPNDEMRRFPMQDRVSVEIVDNHIMEKDFLPGGNLASYEAGGKKWQQFLVHDASPTSAALLLNEYRGVLESPKYIAHMGGYFGKDGDSDVLVMQKGQWLLGIVGLPEKEADTVARGFAARLD